MSRFSCIAADPPWRYRDSLRMDPKIRRGAGDHYPTMTVEEILRLPVLGLATEDAHLWLWTTNAFLVDGTAARVALAWGFRPVTLVTWEKDRLGMGHYLRNTTEHALFAVRGRCPARVHNLPTHFRAPRGRHSAKPDEFYVKYPEALSPGPRVELFARTPRPGWSVWGNEVKADPQVAAVLSQSSEGACEHGVARLVSAVSL